VDGLAEWRPQRNAVFVAGTLTIGHLAEGQLRDRVAGLELVKFRSVLIQPDFAEQVEIGLEVWHESVCDFRRPMVRRMDFCWPSRSSIS